MREREFLDYFPELKGRPEDEQLALLGAARYEAFVRQKLAGKAGLLLVLTIPLGMLIAAIPLMLGADSIPLNTLAIGVALAIVFPVHKRLYGRLLQRGVRRVVERETCK